MHVHMQNQTIDIIEKNLKICLEIDLCLFKHVIFVQGPYILFHFLFVFLFLCVTSSGCSGLML